VDGVSSASIATVVSNKTFFFTSLTPSKMQGLSAYRFQLLLARAKRVARSMHTFKHSNTPKGERLKRELNEPSKSMKCVKINGL
jgi:hypothetical protein